MDFSQMHAWWNDAARENPMTAILSNNASWTAEEFFASGEEWFDECRTFARAAGRSLGGQRALDFGCGLGRMTNALARDFEEAVGIDISEEMVAKGTGVVPRSNVKLLQVKEPPLPFEDEAFDLVFSTIVIQHIPLPYNFSYLHELLRVAKRHLLFDAPSHKIRPIDPAPGPGIFLIDRAIILELAKSAGFELVALREFPATATRQYQYLFERLA